MSKPMKSPAHQRARKRVSVAPSHLGSEQPVQDQPAKSAEREYAFQVGDSNKHCICAVLRVRASNRDEALGRAREAADVLFDGKTVLRYVSDCPWLDSIRVYMDGARLKRSAISLD